jgi:hypothetical protein
LLDVADHRGRQMRSRARVGRDKPHSIIVSSTLSLFLGWSIPAGAADPHTEYMLDCMGCHQADGAGVPGKVPDMRSALVPLARTAAGRRYLIQVPGVAQAPLSDAELAQLVNWMVRHLSARAIPGSFRAFTPGEVAAYRGTPLVEVVRMRRRLLAGTSGRALNVRRGGS